MYVTTVTLIHTNGVAEWLRRWTPVHEVLSSNLDGDILFFRNNDIHSTHVVNMSIIRLLRICQFVVARIMSRYYTTIHDTCMDINKKNCKLYDAVNTSFEINYVHATTIRKVVLVHNIMRTAWSYHQTIKVISGLRGNIPVYLHRNFCFVATASPLPTHPPDLFWICFLYNTSKWYS